MFSAFSRMLLGFALMHTSVAGFDRSLGGCHVFWCGRW